MEGDGIRAERKEAHNGFGEGIDCMGLKDKGKEERTHPGWRCGDGALRGQCR